MVTEFGSDKLQLEHISLGSQNPVLFPIASRPNSLDFWCQEVFRFIITAISGYVTIPFPTPSPSNVETEKMSFLPPCNASLSHVVLAKSL